MSPYKYKVIHALKYWNKYTDDRHPCNRQTHNVPFVPPPPKQTNPKAGYFKQAYVIYDIVGSKKRFIVTQLWSFVRLGTPSSYTYPLYSKITRKDFSGRIPQLQESLHTGIVVKISLTANNDLNVWIKILP